MDAPTLSPTSSLDSLEMMDKSVTPDTESASTSETEQAAHEESTSSSTASSTSISEEHQTSELSSSRSLDASSFGSSSMGQRRRCSECPHKRPNMAVAKCTCCEGFLCASCKAEHKCRGMQSLAGPQQEYIRHLVHDSMAKATELQRSLKDLESKKTKLNTHFVKAKNDIEETFQFFSTLLEKRKTEVLRDLGSIYASKMQDLSLFNRKAQETLELIGQSTQFMEYLLQPGTSGDVLHLKGPIEQKYCSNMKAYNETILASMSVSLEQLISFEYVQPSFSSVPNVIRTNFGYVRSKPDLPESHGIKQPPISRPNANTSANSSLNMFDEFSCSSSLGTSKNTSGFELSRSFGDFGFNGYVIGQQQLTPPSSSTSLSLFGHLPEDGERSYHLTKCLNSFEHVDGSPGKILPDSPPFHSWSSGHGSKRRILGEADFSLANSVQVAEMSSYATNLSSTLLDLSSSSKMLLGGPMMFPLKSQIKRQKMIYHCKFGEFGVLEGQFTEPSGVTVNGNSEIVVADTNNHRIQIFDKEGRFKFQFGECGKHDGQLLYPNRVAIVRQTGDIVVTERSPTHQVQIYNQYGQFVRKFGANVLQHPRGVCVDNKGRIVVVECKVMRVVIFDQLGNVLNKFGCSKHLEFPNGVVVNDRQEIFISDNRAHCVKVFNYEGSYLRQIGGEGVTNYPIGVGITAAGEITIADNHNNFNLSVFSQDGQLLSALESKVKHAQCFDVALMEDGSVVLASKDYRIYIYRYVQVLPTVNS